jgi:phosphohistidine phosphatase
MILYFLRHGLAEDREQWEEDDSLRPLTSKGKKKTEQIAKKLVELIPDLDAIITSPLTRALQTAEIAAEELGLDVIQDERLSPGFSSKELADILSGYPEAAAVMVVGHEPDFSDTISTITGGSGIVMKKGGLARVDVENPTALEGSLVWLIPPKILAL